jgi:hypothetical protein
MIASTIQSVGPPAERPGERVVAAMSVAGQADRHRLHSLVPVLAARRRPLKGRRWCTMPAPPGSRNIQGVAVQACGGIASSVDERPRLGRRG